MSILFLDIETKSQVDLIANGLMRYAQSPTTSVICMAYAFDDDPVKLWWWDEDFPCAVLDHFNNDGIIVAHNADFERHLFDYVIADDYNFEPPMLEQWRCSMVAALTCGFPAGLDAAGRALGLPVQKHVEGTRLIREYCAPGHKELSGEDKVLMGDYCVMDVEVMRGVWLSCRQLTDDEWAEYHLTCRMNERGIPIDVDLCEKVDAYAGDVMADATVNIKRVTNGAVDKPTARKSRDKWLFPRLTEEQKDLLVVYKKGEKKYSLDQDHRGYLLECDDLDPEARLLLEYINDAGSSSLKKYKVAADTHVDGRVNNCFQFNGAQTGRYSGRLLQPHNFRRDAYDADEAADIVRQIKSGEPVDNAATTMAKLLRSAVSHKDGLYWVDWSAIEGRVAPWLTDSRAGEKKLDLFREGKDVYISTAADMYELKEEEVTKAQRQMGKVAELSLQFSGGSGALIGMAKNYGVTVGEEQANGDVQKWRKANPWAPAIWDVFQQAIDDAVEYTGEAQQAGRVTFLCDPQRLFLWCQLPSGRVLAYPRPRYMETYVTPWGEERIGTTFQSHHKPAAGEPPLRTFARGALLFQNAVQATAADILRRALTLADMAGLEIVMSVHDEIVGVGPESDGHRLNEIMLSQPDWGVGLPLSTGGVSWAERYGK